MHVIYHDACRTCGISQVDNIKCCGTAFVIIELIRILVVVVVFCEIIAVSRYYMTRL